MSIYLFDRVKHKEQDITGIVVGFTRKEVIIRDDDAETEDGELIFKCSELEVIT